MTDANPARNGPTTPHEERTGFFCSTASPLAAEILAASGAGFVIIDLQHGEAGSEDLPSLVRAVDGQGAAAYVRVAWCEPSAIMRALDCGAEGVVVPMVETVADATMAARATRYPPLGNRSYGPMRRARPTEEANTSVRCLPMIETELGLERVEDIVAVEGVDGLFIGPVDMALGIGVPYAEAYTSPKVRDGIARCVEAATACGKFVGSVAADPVHAAEFRDLGVSFMALGTDKTFLRSSAAVALETW